MRHSWDKETLEYVISQWRTGRSTGDIAKEIGTKPGAMLNAVERYRPYARKEVREELVKKAAGMWNCGVPVSVISDALGLKERTIRYFAAVRKDIFERRNARRDY